MKIHILQHVPFEGPGYIKEWAEQHGHILSYTRFYETAHHLPDPALPDAVIILGGPMSVFDEHIYDWLHPEKVFIEDAILAGKRVLGICLGAQLAAQCLGATVCTAANREIGWFPVSVTDESQALPWLRELFEGSPTVLHWHGEKFHIPYGGYEILRSAGNTNQAFIYQENVLGIQFHIESTEMSLAEMIQYCGHELQPAPYIQSEQAILGGKKHFDINQLIMAALLTSFLEPAQKE